jgi:hypothetical protein
MISTTIRKALTAGIGTILVFLFLIPASPVAVSGAGVQAGRDVDLSTPITVDLELDRLPRLDEEATATCVVTSSMDAPGTNVTIEIPETATHEGDVSWQLELRAGQPVTVSAGVTFREAGNAAVYCRALRPIDERNIWGDLAAYYFHIGRNDSGPGYAFASPENRLHKGIMMQVGTGQVAAHSGDSPPVQGKSASAVSNPALAPEYENGGNQQFSDGAPAHPLTVTGTWKYYDRNDAYVGAKQMAVELLDGNNSHLAWCKTDDTGYYSCGPVENPGATGVYTMLNSYAWFTVSTGVSDTLTVVDPMWSGCDPGIPDVACAYGIANDTTVFSDGTHSIGVWYIANGDTWERAFWVEQDVINAWRYVWDGTGSAQDPKESTGSTVVEWYDSSTDGAYYMRGENIHLAADNPLSNTVVNHEYGHNIMWTAYGGTMPTSYCPSPHYINGASHVNCAWTEGWANFFSLAVNNDPVYRWDSGASLDLENPTGYWEDGEAVEGRVAGAMWDILDTTNDGFDTYSDGGIANFWDTLYHQNDDNFFQFWQAWTSRGHNRHNAALSIYQNTIDYRYVPPFDFNGSGTSDVAVYRPSTGAWYIRNQFSTYYGAAGDKPVPGDYNGDGTTDIAVYRPSTGAWYIRNQSSVNYGVSTDIPVPGDYNGDGTTEVAVFRPSTGAWYVRGMSTVYFGTSTDTPIPADYNGDGATDIAVYRPSTGAWYVHGMTTVYYGVSTDIPVPGDYDGNGTADIAVFRPSTGAWYIRGQPSVSYGASGDIAIPADYYGDQITDIAVFRPSTGAWYFRGHTSVYYGASGDIPLPELGTGKANTAP